VARAPRGARYTVVMSDDYRDPLAAALSRIEALERENAALKNVQSGRPVTAAELEAVRLENELFRVESQWGDAMKRKYGSPIAVSEKRVDPATTRRRRRIGVAVAVALLFPLLAILLMGGPAGVVVGGIAGTWVAIVGMIFVSQWWMGPRVARDRALLAKTRDPIVRRLAELRGELLPDERSVPVPVRVSASNAAPALEAEAETSAADDRNARSAAGRY